MKKLYSIFLILAALTAKAAWTPFELSLFTPAEVPWGLDEVCGLRIDLIYGRTSSFAGFDLGTANHVRGDASGFQYGCCNFVTGCFDGLQVGDVNFVLTEMTGVQIAWFNQCRACASGLQLGVVNMANDMCGVQIGILNFISQSPLAFFPIVNARF